MIFLLDGSSWIILTSRNSTRDFAFDLINIFSWNLLTISRQMLFAHFVLNIGKKICNHQITKTRRFENEITIIVKFYDRFLSKKYEQKIFIIWWLVSACRIIIISSQVSFFVDYIADRKWMKKISFKFYRSENKIISSLKIAT